MVPYQAIFFDFDYTLGDATPSILAGFAYGLDQLGWPAPDADEIRRTVGYPLEESYTKLTGDRDPIHPRAVPRLFHPGSSGPPEGRSCPAARRHRTAPLAGSEGRQESRRQHQAGGHSAGHSGAQGCGKPV